MEAQRSLLDVDSAAIDPVAEAGSRARVERTPCGDGHVTWRCWGSGRPLVLLHGGTGSWTHWIRNIDYLAARREVWVPDLPGLGDSALPPGELSPGAVAAPLVAGLCDLLGSRGFDLAGFSFGGVVSGFLAAARREHLGCLVLVGAGGLGLIVPPLGLRTWRGVSDARERESIHRHNLLALMLAHPESADPVALRVHVRNAERSRVDSRRMSRTESLRRVLESFSPPLRGIWGAEDVTARGRLAQIEQRLRSIRADAVLRVIPGAGHWVQYEQAAAFNAALVEAIEGEAVG